MRWFGRRNNCTAKRNRGTSLDDDHGYLRATVNSITKEGAVYKTLDANEAVARIAYALKSVTGTVSVHVVGSDGTNDTVVGNQERDQMQARRHTLAYRQQ